MCGIVVRRDFNERSATGMPSHLCGGWLGRYSPLKEVLKRLKTLSVLTLSSRTAPSKVPLASSSLLREKGGLLPGVLAW